jgi:cytochrome c-type biogenesis protein CcmH
VTAALLLLTLVLGQGYEPPTRLGTAPLDQRQEDRVQAVGKMLRCPVCQGVSIADSPSSMARAQLDKVRELVKEGRSDSEIYGFFVARYGEWILMEPTKTGLNAVLWVGPVALLLLGVAIVLLLNQNKQESAPPGLQATAPRASEPQPPAREPPAVDPFLAQVRADLEK